MLFIFDMGGVVTNTATPDLYEKISRQLGIFVNEFYSFCLKDSEDFAQNSKSDFKNNSKSLLQDLENGIISSKEFWNIFAQKSKIPVKCDWFRLLFHPELNKKTVEIINQLKLAGHRVVCGTNTIESHYDNHLSRGDYSFFDMTYASIHMGVSKPDVNFWKLILECENYSPCQTFFTDDKKENCVACESLGIKTYHFKNAQGLQKAVKSFLED